MCLYSKVCKGVYPLFLTWKSFKYLNESTKLIRCQKVLICVTNSIPLNICLPQIRKQSGVVTFSLLKHSRPEICVLTCLKVRLAGLPVMQSQAVNNRQKPKPKTMSAGAHENNQYTSNPTVCSPKRKSTSTNPATRGCLQTILCSRLKDCSPYICMYLLPYRIWST